MPGIPPMGIDISAAVICRCAAPLLSISASGVPRGEKQSKRGRGFGGMGVGGAGWGGGGGSCQVLPPPAKERPRWSVGGHPSHAHTTRDTRSTKSASAMQPRRAVILTVVLTAVTNVHALPVSDATATPPTTTKVTYSLWSSAKHFFNMLNATKPAPGTTPSVPQKPSTVPMPKAFGVEYKQMVAWYCAKPEHKAPDGPASRLCTLNSGKATGLTPQQKVCASSMCEHEGRRHGFVAACLLWPNAPSNPNQTPPLAPSPFPPHSRPWLTASWSSRRIALTRRTR
jgi:hypothetical protein